jgi:hypothetical protein
MKIYYAHHLWKYGTEIEAWELDLIRKRFPGCEIINPNGAIEQGRPAEDIMADCLQKVRECDVLVFSSLSGVIGKGVYRELLEASQHSVPVFHLHHGEVHDEWLNVEKMKNPPSDRHYALVFSRLKR